MKDFKLSDPKANKVVISRNVVLDEKAMLQCTPKEDKHELENCSRNE